MTSIHNKESLHTFPIMSASVEESEKSVFDRLTENMDTEMIQYIVVMAKEGRGNKGSNAYNVH